MNITLEHAEPLIDHIKVEVEPSDYFAAYQNQLKQTTRSISLPGFRPGKVPGGLVQKRFGASLLAEQLNKMVGKALTDYLTEQEIRFVGRPFLSGNEFDNLEPGVERPYMFTFEVGREPEFTLVLPQNNYTRYEVAVSEADVNQRIQRYQLELGAKEPAEMVTPNALHSFHTIGILSNPGKMVDINGNPAEPTFQRVLNVYTALQPAFVPLLNGKKEGDKIEFIPAQLFKDEAEGAALIRVELDFYRGIAASTVQYELRRIFSVQPHELNEAFFNQVLQGQPAADEADFRERLYAKLTEEVQNMTGLYLNSQIRQDLLEANQFELPDRILQRWLLEEYEEFRKPGALEERYAQYRGELRFHLIRKKLAERYPDVAIDDADLRNDLRTRFAGFMPPAPPSAEREHDHALEGHEGHEHTHDHVHAHDENHPHDHSHDLEHSHEGDFLPELPEELGSPLDSLIDNILRNEQFYEREYNTLANKRFYEVLEREVVKVAPREVNLEGFERVMATNSR